MRSVSAALVGALMLFAGMAAAADEYVWESLFPPPFQGPPQMTTAIRCLDATHCLVAGGSNGVGYGVYTFNGQPGGMFTRVAEQNMTLMIMALTAGGSPTKPRATFGGVGFMGVSKPLQYLADNATDWRVSEMPPSFFFIVQSIHSTNDGEHVLALGMGPMIQSESQGTSAISHNGGKSFVEVPIQVERLTSGCSFPNYAALVDNSTWFVTLGGYPGEDQHNNNNNQKKTRRFGHSHVAVQDQATGATQLLKKPFEQPADPKKLCPFNGQIARTTDGGKTFTVLHQSHNYTITKISCRSATHCVALAWGNDPVTGEAFNGILLMKDGQTFAFAKKLHSAYALNALEFVDAQEAWIGGGYATHEAASAVFFVTQDGGETWAEQSVGVPEIEVVFDLSFAKDGSGTGFAVGISEFKTSTVMRYKKQAFAGFFTQKHCPFAPQCNWGCQNVTFPQGLCLEAPGGSAKAYCGADGIVQEMFDTTSCVGTPYKNATMPIDQCLNGTNVYFVNYCNTSSIPSGALPMQRL
uniref:DUF3586 domain-containing protein n=1 Tax=Neobodo designis TaxID=312471 RepID=A0A7S1KYW9_NEODS